MASDSAHQVQLANESLEAFKTRVAELRDENKDLQTRLESVTQQRMTAEKEAEETRRELSEMNDMME